MQRISIIKEQREMIDMKLWSCHNYKRLICILEMPEASSSTFSPSFPEIDLQIGIILYGICNLNLTLI